MRALIIFACLVLLGCAPAITIRIVREEVGVRVDSVAVVDTLKPDSMFFMTPVGSEIITIEESRERTKAQLSNNINAVTYAYLDREGYDVSQGVYWVGSEWNGDWIDNVEFKADVGLRAGVASPDISMTFKWKFSRKQGVWELIEVTHKENTTIEWYRPDIYGKEEE